jgi:cytochrome c556
MNSGIRTNAIGESAMHLALRAKVFLVAGAVLTVALLPATPSYSASGEEVIKARINFMKDDIEGHWKPLAAFASKGVGSLSDVEKNATALAKLAEKLPGHFPKDTGRGKYPDKLTRSLPAIWENWDAFNKGNQRFAAERSSLAQLAREGKKDAVVELIGRSTTVRHV